MEILVYYLVLKSFMEGISRRKFMATVVHDYTCTFEKTLLHVHKVHVSLP